MADVRAVRPRAGGRLRGIKQHWDRTIDEVLEANATTDFALRLNRERIPAMPGIPEPVWSVTWRPVMAFNVWLLLPDRLEYAPRAYAGIKRVRAA